jgi:RimJ/RimL family protein N-acetyltransferase
LSEARIEFPVEGISDGEILLRLMAEADIPAVIDAVQDPEIPRWTRVPSPYGREEAEQWYAQQASARDDGTMLSLLIVDAGSGNLAGSLGITEVSWEEARCDLGYWLAHAHRGRGIMPRAIRLLARWIFDSLPIERITILADTENEPSRRTAERAGFTYEGVLRSYIVIKGHRRDMASYSLLRGELPS